MKYYILPPPLLLIINNSSFVLEEVVGANILRSISSSAPSTGWRLWQDDDSKGVKVLKLVFPAKPLSRCDSVGM